MNSEYDVTLRNLQDTFPPVTTVTAVARYLHRDYRSLLADRTFPVERKGGRYYVKLTRLARWLS